MTPRDWDTAYNNMSHVAGSAELPAHWGAEAAAYRAGCSTIEEDIAYGSGVSIPEQYWSRSRSKKGPFLLSDAAPWRVCSPNS